MGKKAKKPPMPERELTRKELRKEQRLLKKQGRALFFEAKKKSSKNTPTNVIITKQGQRNVKNQKMNVKVNLPSNEQQNKKNSFDNLIEKMKNQRKKQLIDANEKEEREIKMLEKRLNLTKTKAVSTSKGFVDTGLDYILDVCDPERIHSAVNSEMNFEDSDSDFFEDISMIQGNNDNKDPATVTKGEKKIKKRKSSNSADEDTNVTRKSQANKKLRLNSESSHENVSDTSLQNEEFSYYDTFPDEYSDHEGGKESVSDDGEMEIGIESDTDLEVDVPESGGEVDKSDDKPKPEVWEDIYGRLRDQKGNILKNNDGKYVPPHLRNTGDSDEVKKRKELMRQLKGLLNRLALNNMNSIANQIEDLYTKHSRYSMNEALFTLYIDSLVAPVLSPERLIIDHAMLIAVLHANVGSEIGAYMLQNLVHKFNAMLYLSQTVENKALDNLLLLISYLYNLKVFEACLMYDILNKLCCQFTEKNIDLILVVLKSVGFSLRKDDPMAMKAFLLSVQKEVNKASEVDDRSRMKYMLEILLSIKNNNVSKLSDFDPEQHEHLKKVLKSVVRSGNTIVALRIGLEDLLKAEERGRWWIVGSAWNKADEEGPQPMKEDLVSREEFSAQLLTLAKQQRMNTDNRRNIFCILMSAEDYQDAFEKVLKLGLKGQQEREIPLVIIHCLLQEKCYNPYYAHIADQLCLSNRRHQMSLQCALWDRFRALEKLSSPQINSLAKFLAQLLLAGSIPISVLKVVEFTELDKRHIRLLRQTILTIANEEAKDSVDQVFMRVTKSKKLSLFREALRLFIHHFILRNMPDGVLKERVSHINLILTGEVS